MADERTGDFDSVVVRFLAVTPGIEHWRDVPLPAHVQRWMNRASHDELLGAIAASLQRLAREQKAA